MRETSNFPPAGGVKTQTDMATLGELLKAKEITAIKAVATAKTDAETYATHVCDKAWNMLYDLAVELGQKLDKRFWLGLDYHFAHGETSVLVCMKGKHECDVMSMVYGDRRWAQHLGEKLKRGYKLVFVHRHYAKAIDWDNWKAFYADLMKEPEKTEGYDPYNSPADIRRMVGDMARTRRFHAAASVTGRKALPTMQECYYQRVRNTEMKREDNIKLRRDEYSSQVTRKANKILAAV